MGPRSILWAEISKSVGIVWLIDGAGLVKKRKITKINISSQFDQEKEGSVLASFGENLGRI